MTASRPLRPESELLLWCLRRALHSSTEAAPGLRLSSLDWAYVLDVACQAGVAPLIFDVLHPTARAHAPGPIADALCRYHSGNRATTVLRCRELGQVLAALGARGIQTIALHGLGLAQSVYPDV